MKATATKRKKRSAKRRPFPCLRVAELWSQGRTIAEIAVDIGRIGKGEDRYHGLRVHLTRMHRGYRDASGNLVKLPYRVSRGTLRLAKLAGQKAIR